MDTPRLTLSILPETFAVCRLEAHAPIPDWTRASSFNSITRTRDELSIVCDERNVPQQVTGERGWRCLKLEGPFDFALVGILVSVVEPLARAAISVFAIATYDTDYVLIKAADLLRARQVLIEAGHRMEE